MADRNAVNMDSLQNMKAGIRTSYMADLYDSYITGVATSRGIDIVTFEPEKFPLATLFMDKARRQGQTFTSQTNNSWFFEWGETAATQTLLNRKVVTGATVTSGDSGSDATITVVSSVGVKKGDILVAYGSENLTPSTDLEKIARFLVTNVASATSIATKRINVAGFTVKNGQNVYVMGSAYADSAEVSDPMYNTITKKYGSCQIFKNSIKMTRRQKGFTTQYGNDWYFQLEQASRDHKMQIEMALLSGYRPEGFGKPEVDTSAISDLSGRPVTFTMGLDQAIGFANSDFSAISGDSSRRIIWTKGNTTIEDVQTSFDNIFEYGSGRASSKYMFGGLGVKSFLRLLANNDKIKIMNTARTALGILVNQIETDNGIITYVQHPLMKGPLANRFYIIDHSLIETPIIAPTTMHLQGKGVNSEIHHSELITDMGLAVKLLPLHASGIIL